MTETIGNACLKLMGDIKGYGKSAMKMFVKVERVMAWYKPNNEQGCNYIFAGMPQKSANDF